MSVKERIIKLKYDYHLNLDITILDNYPEEELRVFLQKLVEHCEKK